MELGSTIRRLRKERKLTAKEVAGLSGISANALCATERNKSFPTKKTFFAICEAIGVPYYLVLIECVTIDDIPPENREAFNILWPPIINYLKS